MHAVARLVRFRLGREDEDAVSEVFLRAWRGLGTYRDTSVPFARVALRDRAARGDRRAQGLGTDEPRAELPEAEVEPMTAELLTLHDAIERLPTEQRQVIELKYLVGLSNAEVAAAMDSSPGAINAKQWRALKALADVLEERS